MSSGKKNYFRHSFHARKHEEIARLIDDHGKEAYFHFFVLCEVCAERASDKFPDDNLFIFRRSTLCRELLVTNSRLSRHLLVMVPSLVDDIVVTENDAKIIFPKLRKYLGRYESKSDSNSPNKRKEKEIKEKENKVLVNPSPLSFLFDHMPEVQAWLNAGSHDTHLIILKKYPHNVLSTEVVDMYVWANRNNLRAESWMYKRLLNLDDRKLAQKPAQKPFSGVHPIDPLTDEEIQILKQAGQL